MTTIVNQAMSQSGKASSEKKTFNQTTEVSIDIQADPAIIWALLTNASDFPRWNSTIVFIKGEIRLKEKIELKSTLDDKRTFKIKIKEFEPDRYMRWGDGKGDRTFTLTDHGNGTTTFHMHEKIGGLMYPMYAKYLPDFVPSFEQYAADLKKEAEAVQKGDH